MILSFPSFLLPFFFFYFNFYDNILAVHFIVIGVTLYYNEEFKYNVEGKCIMSNRVPS